MRSRLVALKFQDPIEQLSKGMHDSFRITSEVFPEYMYLFRDSREIRRKGKLKLIENSSKLLVICLPNCFPRFRFCVQKLL